MKHLKHLKHFEDINLNQTFFNRILHLQKKLQNKCDLLILNFIKENNIKEPVQLWSKDFIKVKVFLEKNIEDLIEYENYHIESSTLKVDIIKDILFKYFKIETPKKEKQYNFSNISGIDFKHIKTNDFNDIYEVIFPKEINDFIYKNYDVNYLDKFIYIVIENNPNLFTFKENRVHFPGRSERSYIYYNKYQFSYLGRNGINFYNLLEGIPNKLRGYGLCLSIYKALIEKFEYISTNDVSSNEIKSVWKKIIKDDTYDSFVLSFNDKQKGLCFTFKKDCKSKEDIIKKILKKYNLVSLKEVEYSNNLEEIMKKIDY